MMYTMRMSDKPDILTGNLSKQREIYTDQRGNELILNGLSQTAVVISRRSGKLCDLSNADADRQLEAQTRLIETSVWQQIFSAPRYTAPPHFIASLCGVVEADTETITVKRRLYRFTPTTMSDMQGNVVEFPTAYEKRDAKAHVKDMSGKTLCEVDKKIALALDTASPQDHLRNKALLLSYQFEATPGAIPNLCKKDGLAK